MGRIRHAWLWLLKRTLNPPIARLAETGRGPFALVRHVGRRTGKPYVTPLLLARVREGFVAELTYGEDVAWYRNVSAAGSCEVVFRGVVQRVERIEPYPTELGRRAFGLPARIVLTLMRRREFRLLHTG